MDSAQQPQPPIAPFDHIPDHLLLLIFNKLFDAKSLVRCLSVSKRFASLVPLTDAVFLPLFLPPTTTTSPHGGSSVSFLKSLFNYVFIKPLRLFRRHYRALPSDSPTQCPPLLLNTFYHITFLHFELHSYGGSVDAEFLKWKATFGSQLKRCVVVCATSFHRGIPEREEEEEASSSERALASEDLKSRIMWTISCLIAASARHFLLKQMLLKFPTLKRIVISDSNKQGMFRMGEGELAELRDYLLMEQEGATSFRSERRVVPDLRMRMWYEPELKLPESGCVMKGATMILISPTGEMMVAAENGGDGAFDGDDAETAVFGEAEREIAKRKSSHVMEMTSF